MGRKNRRIPNLERVHLLNLGNKGKAVGRHDNRVVFVNGGVPGDVVDVQVTKAPYLPRRKGNPRPRIQRRPDRSAVRALRSMWGCRWQNLNYNKQLFYKEKEVQQNLKKIGHITPKTYHPILGSAKQFRYRNKLEFSFTDNKWLTQEQLDSDEVFEERRGAGFHIQDSGTRCLILILVTCNRNRPMPFAISFAIGPFSETCRSSTLVRRRDGCAR